MTRKLEDAKASPVERPIGRLARRSVKTAKPRESSDGVVIGPEDEEPEVSGGTQDSGSVHTEMQYLLVKLGADMG